MTGINNREPYRFFTNRSELEMPLRGIQNETKNLFFMGRCHRNRKMSKLFLLFYFQKRKLAEKYFTHARGWLFRTSIFYKDSTHAVGFYIIQKKPNSVLAYRIRPPHTFEPG